MLKCEKKLILPADEIGLAWKIYLDSFSGQESICAQNQICFKKKKFYQTMKDDDWIKFLLFLDNTLIGLCLSTNNLRKAQVGYINPRFLKARYPEYTGKIYYTPIICIHPDYKKTKNARRTLNISLADHVIGDNGMVFCDFAGKNKHMPQLIVNDLDKGPGISAGRKNYYTIMDSQIYVAIKSE